MYNEAKKMDKKKKIELVLVVVLLFWVLLFLVDYMRFSNSKPPLLSLKLQTEYEDGTVTEYYSIGYVYRVYNRNSLKKEELVPFFKLRENPEAQLDLPDTYSGYNVPENPYHNDKYKSLLYFYNSQDLVGTYKCINSSNNCEKAIAGADEYDILNNDYLTARSPRMIGFIHNRFAFVDDSKEQEKKYGETGYFRTIYLVDILENKIIAKYSDVKDSDYDDLFEVGIGDNDRYIVRDYDTNKWGIIKIDEDGNIEEVLKNEYKSINYDIDTGYYIMCKDNKWYGYDLDDDKVVTLESEIPIFDVWYNDNKTLYYKTGKRVDGEKNIFNFKIYRFDGKDLLTQDNNILSMETDSYVMYLSTTDNKLHFIDYTATEQKSLQLFFNDLDSDELHHPAFILKTKKKDHLIIYAYKGRELKDEYVDYFVNTVYWD